MRDLYNKEREALKATLDLFKENPQELKNFLSPVFNKDRDQVERYKRREMNQYLFNADVDDKDNLNAPRRYFAQPGILGWNIFDMEEDFHKEWTRSQRESSQQLFQDGTEQTLVLPSYGDYVDFIQKTIDPVKMARVIIVMAYSLLTPQEVIAKQMAGEWDEWLEDVATWYANTYIQTPWWGKQREHYAQPLIKAEVLKYFGLRLAKTSVENDRRYKIDFVVLGASGDPVLGISVKGMSWYRSNASGESTYQKGGEVREVKGHKSFTRKFKAPVVIVVSEPGPAGMLGVIGPVREALKALEEAGEIEKC